MVIKLDGSFQLQDSFGLSKGGNALNASPTSALLDVDPPEEIQAPISADSGNNVEAVESAPPARSRLFKPMQVGLPEQPNAPAPQDDYGLGQPELRPDQQFLQDQAAAVAAPNAEVQQFFQQLDGQSPGRFRVIDKRDYDSWKKGWDDNQPGWIEDNVVRLGGGSIVESTGYAVRGLGEMVRSIEDATTTPLINAIFGTDFQTVNLAEVPAEAIESYGAKMKSGISVATREALVNSSPGGDFFDPTTWTLGEDPSLRGYTALVFDVFGSMVPIIAAGVAAGPGGAAAVGGAQGGGAASKQSKEAIDIMAETPGMLEKESSYYRQLIAAGHSHEQAWARTREAAAKASFIFTAPISALGGAATSKLLNPATKVLAGRNFLTQAGGRIGLSALEEGTQEATETMAGQLGMNVGAGTSKNITDGTFGDFILGALAGGTAGSGAAVTDSILDLKANKMVDPKGMLGKAVQHGDRQTPEQDFDNVPVKDETRARRPDVQQVQQQRDEQLDALDEVIEANQLQEGTIVTVNDPEMGTFNATIDSVEPEGVIVFNNQGEIHLVQPETIMHRQGEMRSVIDEEVDANVPAPAPTAEPAQIEDIPAAQALPDPNLPLDLDQEVQAEIEPAPAPVRDTPSPRDILLRQQSQGMEEQFEAPQPTQRKMQGRTVSFPDEQHAQLFDLGDKIRKGRMNSKMDVKALLKDDIEAAATALGITPDAAAQLADDYRFRADQAGKRREGDFRMPEAGSVRLDEMRKQKARAEKKVADDAQKALDLAAPESTVDVLALDAATSPTNDTPEPTKAQKEAGNYKVGRVRLGGQEISIENPAGSERKGTDKDGKTWSVTMKSHYGYFKGTVGKDKDHIDTFIRKGTENVADKDFVFVVDQVNESSEFDEHKVMLGFKSLAQAKVGYLANYEKGWKGLGKITKTNMAGLRNWFNHGDTTKPFQSVTKQPAQKAAVEVVEVEPKAVKEPAKDKATEPARVKKGYASKRSIEDIMRNASPEKQKAFGDATLSDAPNAEFMKLLKAEAGAKGEVDKGVSYEMKPAGLMVRYMNEKGDIGKQLIGGRDLALDIKSEARALVNRTRKDERFGDVVIGDKLADGTPIEEAAEKLQKLEAKKEQVKTEQKSKPDQEKWEKTTLTVKNHMGADFEQEVYAKGGIGVGKFGKEWRLFHIASNRDFPANLNRRTKAEATKVAENLLALDIDWHGKRGDAAFDAKLREIAPLVNDIAVGVDENPVAVAPNADPDNPKFLDTRGSDRRFHGARRSLDVDSLDDNSYTSLNYYGQGFYTTDAVAIANGYAKNNMDNIFEISEVGDIKPFDLEKKVPDWLIEDSDPDVILDARDAALTTVRGLFDEIRDIGTSEGDSADTIQEYYEILRERIEGHGYNVLDHKGGLRTKKTEHAVRIYLSPSSSVEANKAYPAGILPRGLAKKEKPLAQVKGKGPARDAGRLYVTHNISPEGIMWSEEIGGLPAPSLAIAGADTGFDSFGDISLIGPSAMAEPGGKTRIYNADVYSPRQPRAEYDIKGPEFKRMMEKLDAAATALGTSISGRIDPDRVSSEGLYAVAREDVTRLAYLMDIGKAPRVKYQAKSKMPEGMAKFAKRGNQDLYENAEFEAAALEYVNKELEKYAKRLNIDSMKDRWLVEDNGEVKVSYSKLDEIIRDMKAAIGPKKVDTYETGRMVRKRTQTARGANKPEYTKWVENNFGDVLDVKFFTDTNRRRKPYEINALVRDMTRTVRDGEGFNYGVGSIRSTVAKQFKSLSQIKGDRGQVVSETTMEAMKEEVNNEFVAMVDKFKPYHSASSDFGFMDIISEFFKDYANGNLREWQESIFSEPIPKELQAETHQFLMKLTDLPTEYFEIKMQRAVDLSEFHTALVPKNTSKEVVDVLKRKGLKIVRYEKDNEGKGRNAALDKVSSDVFFRAGGKQEVTNQNVKDLLEIVQKVGGLKDAKVVDTILIDDAPGWDMDAPTQAAGLYYPVSDQVVLAADIADNRTAYHESFHRLQNMYLTRGERAQLKADAPRLRRIVRTDPDLAPLVKGMSQQELEAEAFAIYSTKGTDINPLKSVRAAWDFIADLVDKTKAYLKGENINATTDLFAEAKRGDVAKRKAGEKTLKADEKPLSRPLVPKNMKGDNFVKEVAAELKGKWTDMSPSLLNLVPLNYFPELAQENMTGVKDYMRTKQAMDTFRGDQHAKADELAQTWLKYVTSAGGYVKSGADKMRAEHLSELMHESTLAGVDPSSKAEKHVDHPQYKKLRAKYEAMPPAGRELYKKVRDSYKEQSGLLDTIILENIEKTQVIAQKRAQRDFDKGVERLDRKIEVATRKGDKTRLKELKDEKNKLLDTFKKDYARAKSSGAARMIKMRRMFEKTKANDPYFPLARVGEYFVSVRDEEGDVISFSRREKVVDRDKLAAQMRDAYPDATVETGVLEGGGADTKDAMDPRMVGDIQNILGEAGIDDKVMDMVWQRYLESMPDLSTRKQFIHRKGTAGFDADALKAFSKHMFHASHQMARLKYGMDLTEATNVVADQGKVAPDPTKGVRLANQLKKNHQWVMNPMGNAFSQRANSIAFVWFLGVTPAAALVNLTQTPMMGIPIIGARFGFDKAAVHMARSSADSVLGKGNVSNSPKLTDIERKAMQEFERSGLIDKTQAHDLAGVGDTGVTYNPLMAKTMAGIGFFFHRAEVWNREVTALTAFRAAVDHGQSYQQALETAHELTWASHFDYSNSSRPSILQNDFAKVAFVFRAHSINMIYRVVRDIHQSMKGDTPEARRIARRQLVGVFGMLQLFAGTTGLFGFNQAMWILNMVFGDDDDPLDFETRMKRDLIDVLGPQLGGIILNGAPGHYTKTDLTSRIGLADVWFRSSGRDLEGRDQWQDWIIQTAGASTSMVGNWLAGADYIRKGQFADGIELAAPKAIRDAMRSYRRISDGVVSAYSGNQIIGAEDIGIRETIAQGIGFTPASVGETWERNSALRRAETKVMRHRSQLLNAYALAFSMKDKEQLKDVLDRIKKFNRGKANRGLAITAKTIKQSLATRRRNANKRQDGVIIQNKQLDLSLRKALPTRIHE